jgi:hypothetical protein
LTPHGHELEFIDIKAQAFAFNQRSAVAQVFQRSPLGA